LAGRERWTALAAGGTLLVLLVVLTLVQLPFTIWSAGELDDLYGSDGLVVSGVPTYPVSGHLQVAGMSVAGQTVSLGRALSAFSDPHQAVIPQFVDYPIGLPIPQVAVGQSTQESLRAAEAAAVRQVGLPVERAPRVFSVLASGPSYGNLLVDDVIEAVGSTTVTSVAEFDQAMKTHSVGDTIQLTVTRDGVRLDSQIDVVAQASSTSGNEQPVPSLGVTLGDSYLLGGIDVSGAPADIGAGLMVAIGVYDMLSGENLLGGVSVAGAGMLDANGVVSNVAGANERLQAAEAATTDIFLLPQGNCVNVSLAGVEMRVIPVSSLGEALSSLEVLKELGPNGVVPSCPG